MRKAKGYGPEIIGCHYRLQISLGLYNSLIRPHATTAYGRKWKLLRLKLEEQKHQFQLEFYSLSTHVTFYTLIFFDENNLCWTSSRGLCVSVKISVLGVNRTHDLLFNKRVLYRWATSAVPCYVYYARIRKNLFFKSRNTFPTL